jgi:D-aminopeptidase
MLNDMRGMHVHEEHVHAALDAATTGPVAEGCVGSGTGMTCFDFKGGIGTSSRVVEPYPGSTFAVGVLAMTNFGNRERLTVDGVPVGREIADLMPREHREGSCIVVMATDAPLSARQCERMAKRCSLGLAVTGSYAADSSGEFMIAFTTAHRVPRVTSAPVPVTSIGNDAMYSLFEAAVDATAEAVLNSLCAATDTEGRNGNRSYALPLDRLVQTMGRFSRQVHLPDVG